MPLNRLLYVPFLVLFVVVSCQAGETAPDGVTRLAPPVATPSGQPHLHVDDDGTLWMSWVEGVGEDVHALRYASFNGEAWSEPGTVATGEEWFVNWADVPSIRTLPDGRMAAHFLVSNGPHIFAYDVRIAQTGSDGSWQEAVTPHRDGTQTEHGFVSMLPWDDNLLAVWLDGREMNLGEDAHGHGSGPMTLRSALLDSSGDIVQKFLLDDRVCECCPTSAVLTNDGALVAYRDRSEDEVRNIGLVHFDGETWSEPYPLHDDGWRIEGCPVNGPSLTADGDRVAASWFTAADDEPRVRLAFSNNGGRTFGEPILVDDDRPAGHVDVALLADGSALVSWHGRDGDTPALRVRRVYEDGTMTPATTVVSPMPPARAGIPRMVRSDDALYFAWVDVTENEDATGVHVARANVHDFEE